MPQSMRCSAVQPGGSPCKYPATIGDLCGVHHRKRQRQATAADAEPPPAPFQMYAIQGEPPWPPPGRWPDDIKPTWTAYRVVMARSPGVWHVIDTDDEVWAYKGCSILRSMGCEAEAHGSCIYARVTTV